LDNKLIIALVDSIVSDAIKKIEFREGPQGPRGIRGKDGNDFRLEDHTEAIVDLILQHIPKTFDLTDEQIALLKGEPGKDGRDGRDGIDGKDFNFDEHSETITQIITDLCEKLALKFEDLTSEQIEALRGPQGESGLDGRNGRDGRDFIFEEHEEEIAKIIEDKSLKFEDLSPEQIEAIRGPKGDKGEDGRGFDFAESQDQINNLIVGYLNQVRDSLKLKFDDLTEDDKAVLRGPRGQRGKPGRDFDLEESLPTIKNAIQETVVGLTPDLKLKFSDLSEEEKDSLKLKFEHLTPEDRLTLRGPRGQRGKIGIQGEQGPAGRDGRDGIDGKDGKMGPQGLPGLKGRDGRDGLHGRDGADAPRVTDVRVAQDRKSKAFHLVFEFEDGSEISTGDIQIPKGDTTFYYPAGVGGGSGSGSTIRTGSGAPSPVLGTDGDLYLDTASHELYGPKTLGDWGTPTSLVGPAGANGTNGTNGTNGADGADGADGASAYEIAVANGFVGTEADWLASLSGGGGSVGVMDEYNQVSSAVESINFIGPYVKVRPRVNMSEWDPTSEVEPSLSDFPGDDGNPKAVDVYFDIPDPNVISGVDCQSDVYVGSFVRMDNDGKAHNALADSYINSNVIGVVESKPSPIRCDIRVLGKTGSIFTGLDTTLNYFLSDTIPGGLTSTPPTTPGHIMIKLGQAFSISSFLIAKGDRIERA
jgi:hypothetical protein